MAESPTMPTFRALCGCLLALALAVTGCAPDVAPVDRPGFGRLELALTGPLGGAVRLRVRIYEGPATSLQQAAKYTLANCAPYTAGNNQLQVSDLKVRSDYAVLVELYGDTACKDLRYRAYRGGIAVATATAASAKARPYYIQPYEIGKFTSLATVNPALRDEAAKKTCSSDADCRAIHVNAACTKEFKCTVDHLFPLNGGGRRGFPTVVGLDDGRVAVAGGLTASIAGVWTATIDRVEVFEPTTGIFRAQSVANGGAPVGLAESVTLVGGSLAVVGGLAAAKVVLEPGNSLTTALEPKGCGGAGSACSVSRAIARWDLKNPIEGVAQQLSEDGRAPLAFPVVARVRTPAGERVLVAGGAQVPLPSGTADSRKGASVLCKMDAGGVTCADGATMQAGRARAAVGCLDGVAGACNRLLVLGGRKSTGTPLAEIYDATTDKFVAATIAGAVPQGLHGGHLLAIGGGRLLLVGASQQALFLEDSSLTLGSGIAPLIVEASGTASEPVLTFTAANLGTFEAKDGGKRMLATAVTLADGGALLIGGIGTDLLPLADALRFDSNGNAVARIELSASRFGAGAARIGGQGPLGGCTLLAGGYHILGTTPQPQNHVEIFCPAP